MFISKDLLYSRMTLLFISAFAVLLNLPFGYWRAGTRKFSLQWFLAIHVPVPLIIGIRLVSGIGWQIMSFPLLIGAFFAGQSLGGLLKRITTK
jgi:hypothetical protein